MNLVIRERAKTVAKLKNCRVCGTTALVEVLNFGDLALTGAFPATNVTVSPGGVAGATHSFVDENHGHGDVAYGVETLGSDVDAIDMGGYGVSVLSWP